MNRFLKYFIYILTIFIFSFLFLNLVNASSVTTATVNSSNGLSVRPGPGTNYDRIAVLSNGTNLSLVSTDKYSDQSTDPTNSCVSGWYKINYNSGVYYVCSSVVGNLQTINSSNLFVESDWSARVNASDPIGFRYQYNETSIIRTLSYGTNLTILDTAPGTSSCTPGWYKAKVGNDIGYVCSKWVIKKSDITRDDPTLNQTWANLGFPSSYYPYLNYLKAKYPNWSFEAQRINANFVDVVQNESNNNSINSTDTSLVTSTDVVEAGGWRNTRNEVNAFYLDPRNFLNEKMIFIFEDNTITSGADTRNIALSLYNGGNLSQYVDHFMEASNETTIASTYLVSRSIQEVGRNASSVNNGSGGAYVFFNIGAWGSCPNPASCGLQYASKASWTTPLLGIKGGAWFIKNDYYDRGQKNFYLHKFDLITGRYSHQYMANIQAPIAECSNIYWEYIDANVINSSFKFIIPVFNNEGMPSVTSLPGSESTNNNLTSIKINGTNIPNFDPDILSNYTFYVANNVTSVTVEATKEDSTSTITGTGTINLTGNDTTINVGVTSASGVLKTYTIVIKKSANSAEANLSIETIINSSSGKILNNTFVSGYTLGTTANTLTNSLKKVSPSATVTIRSNGTIKPSPEPLKTGDTLTVVNAGGISKTLTLVVKGDTSSNGEIDLVDLLMVQKQIKGFASLSSTAYSAADVNYDGNVNLLDLLIIRKNILGYMEIK